MSYSYNKLKSCSLKSGEWTENLDFWYDNMTAWHYLTIIETLNDKFIFPLSITYLIWPFLCILYILVDIILSQCKVASINSEIRNFVLFLQSVSQRAQRPSEWVSENSPDTGGRWSSKRGHPVCLRVVDYCRFRPAEQETAKKKRQKMDGCGSADTFRYGVTL